MGWRLISAILICLGPVLCLPQVSFAQIVINEFLPDLPTGQNEDQEEWVELYNLSDTEINLHGWVLKDSDDNHQRLITNTTISPHGFVVIKRLGSNFSLNNSSDAVRLFESTQSAQPVDSFSYSETNQNESWGRIPDGTGGFQNHLNPSSGQANQPLPTMTPRPSPTFKPTKEPESATQSSNDAHQSPADEPTKTPSNQQVAFSQSSLGLVQGVDDGIASDSTRIATVAGIIDRSSYATPSAEASTSTQSRFTGSAPTKMPLIFLTTGAVFITAGFAPELIKSYRKREE